MADDQATILVEPAGAPAAEPGHEVPFGVNEMRLNLRQWVAALVIVAICLVATPRIWKKIERFETGADYRIPYALSKDYWLYERRMAEVEDPAAIVVIG